jgi:hypothetical protein
MSNGFIEAHKELREIAQLQRLRDNQLKRQNKKYEKELLENGKQSRRGQIRCLKYNKKVWFDSKTGETQSHECI